MNNLSDYQVAIGELGNAAEASLPSLQNHFAEIQNTWFVGRPREFFCLELCGEAGELANLEKKSWKGIDIPAVNIEDEAADVFIALMNYCNVSGINLGAAVASKLSTIQPSKNIVPEA